MLGDGLEFVPNERFLVAVEPFRPHTSPNMIFDDHLLFREALLCKGREKEECFGERERGKVFAYACFATVLNGERAAMYAPVFQEKMKRTRQQLMSALIDSIK